MVPAMVNGGGQRRSTAAVTAGPPVNHRRTTGQPPPNHRSTVVDRQSTAGSGRVVGWVWSGRGSGQDRVGHVSAATSAADSNTGHLGSWFDKNGLHHATKSSINISSNKNGLHLGLTTLKGISTNQGHGVHRLTSSLSPSPENEMSVTWVKEADSRMLKVMGGFRLRELVIELKKDGFVIDVYTSLISVYASDSRFHETKAVLRIWRRKGVG
ncbi:hypothetical protein Tco_0702427 [Tanacetum coccineum]|uniref:Uncharacterized protein n=1 Tax=Tanacetum coccineum TaxID=301880 RepID=A0ABQ4XXJ9_9ASTR